MRGNVRPDLPVDRHSGGATMSPLMLGSGGLTDEMLGSWKEITDTYMEQRKCLTPWSSIELVRLLDPADMEGDSIQGFTESWDLVFCDE